MSNSESFTKLKGQIQKLWPGSDDASIDDATVKVSTYANAPMPVEPNASMGNSYDALDQAVHGIAGAGGTIFTTMAMATATMSFDHMRTAITMMQAVILLCIYMLLPLIVLLSGYRLESMWYGAVAIFTVKFWTVLWMIAQFLDSGLWKAMYPGLSGTVLAQAANTLSRVQPVMALSPAAAAGVFFENDYGSKRIILNIILMAMFVGFPVIFSTMMTWIGINVGRGLSTMMEGNAQPAVNKSGMSIPVIGKLLR